MSKCTVGVAVNLEISLKDGGYAPHPTPLTEAHRQISTHIHKSLPWQSVANIACKDNPYPFTDLATHLQIYVHIYRSMYTFTDLATHLQIYTHLQMSIQLQI